jgi:hypothetical protein
VKAGLEEEWNRRWQAVLGKNMGKEGKEMAGVPW